MATSPAESTPASPAAGLDRPDFSRFLDCTTRRLATPVLTGPGGQVRRGVVELSWHSPQTDVIFVLEEARTADFANPRALYRGPARQRQVQADQQGHSYFRVSAELGDERSAPSAVLALTVRDAQWRPSGGTEVVGSEPERGEDALLRIHQGLLALAAATGELFAVLSLPRQWLAPDAIRYAARLRATAADPRALSFGALYHPWVQWAGAVPATGEPGRAAAPRICPPDGVAAGVLARRARERGAWVAPANEPLRGLVALTPTIPPAAWLPLQQARVNLIRAEPRGFLCLDADTLSLDADWRAIQVRRLFNLLRRLALRRGLSYVFEPNGDLLRRAVERGFNVLLADLDRRGAFAGATPDESFRVVTSGAINTAADRADGRFLVELRVAPAAPLRFLTLRLLQRGERLTLLEEA